MGFLNKEMIGRLGLKHVGRDVQISDKASLYGASRISLGDHVRIDDFAVLSAGVGGISIGRNVHVAVYSSLMGAGEIVIDDFAGLSSRVAVYSSNDDYSGEFMTNPTIPAQFTNVTSGKVEIQRHAIVGCGAVILPNVTIGVGASVGAMALVMRDCEPFSIYAGNPARFVRKKSDNVLKIEGDFLAYDDSQQV